jgi:predicted kinase
LIRFHQVPFHFLDHEDSRRRVIEVSQTARCDLLALVAEADARGRECADQGALLETVTLFTEYCEEQGCLSAPYPFPSDHARFMFFRTPGRDPAYAAHDDTRCEVVLMSGLPGAGKDRWLSDHLPDRPVVSLDAIRADIGVAATDAQAAVVARAREDARALLCAGCDFAWNGTNLSRDLRERSISLFADYWARVRIVYLEVPPAVLWQQNRERPSPVPEAAIQRLLSRWEVPDRTEAHRLEWLIRT